MKVYKKHFDIAVNHVVQTLDGIDNLFPHQIEPLRTLINGHNIFYTASTNSGKTLPPVLVPYVMHELNGLGYSYPRNPKIIFLTALDSIKLSLLTSMSKLGLECSDVKIENVVEALDSNSCVLFISPEIVNLPNVTKELIKARSDIVLKTVDQCHLGKS